MPQALQEELLGSVTALVESIECVPPPAADEEDEGDDGEDRGKGKKKGKDKKEKDD